MVILIVLGIIDATSVNKIMRPPTIIKNNENPTQEFLVKIDTRILIKVAIKIIILIILLDEFLKFIIKRIKIIIIIGINSWNIAN